MPGAYQLKEEFLDQWYQKVFSLEEFLGDKTESQLAFAPQEKMLLDFLRQERKDNPMFTDKTKSFKERTDAFKSTFFRNTPPAYTQITGKLKTWLDDQIATKGRPDPRVAELKARGKLFFMFLAVDIQKKHNLDLNGEKYKELDRLTDLAWRSFDKAGLFQSVDKRLAEEGLAPLDKILYGYYVAALPANSVLQALDKSPDPRELYKTYRDYTLNRRGQAESTAYEHAEKELEYAAGVVSRPVAEERAAPQEQEKGQASKGWVWLLLAVGIVALALRAGILFYRRLPFMAK